MWSRALSRGSGAFSVAATAPKLGAGAEVPVSLTVDDHDAHVEVVR
jgi:hypothetical protein